MMDRSTVISELVLASGIEAKPVFDYESFVSWINEILITDFDRLIRMLYLLDVDEKLLKTTLANNPDADAGVLIADLMIERQLKKTESRRKYNQRDNDIDENEKW